jgi:hypothetical protein
VIARPSYFFLSAFADAAKRLIVHRSRLLRSLDRCPRPMGEVAPPPIALVDRLAAPGGEREAIRLLRSAVRADSDFARSFRPGARDHAEVLDRPSLYAVDAALDPAQGELHVRATALWTNRGAEPVGEVVFRVLAAGQDLWPHNARLLAATANGVPTEGVFDGTILRVALPAPVPPDGLARVQLDLVAGLPPIGHQPSWTGPLNAERIGIFGSRPELVTLGGWLPLIVPRAADGTWDAAPLPTNGETGWNEPALFDVWLDVPPGWEVATTGVELSRTEDDRRRRIHATASAVREFAVETGPHLAVAVGEVGGVRVRVTHAAEYPEIGRDFLRNAEGALLLFDERFGPLPLAEIDIVDAPVNVALGNEFPGLVTLDTHHAELGTYLRSRYHEWTLAHELAHQWWSIEVGSDPRAEPWLDEALAAWSASLYWRREHGSVALEARHREDVVLPHADMRDRGLPDLPADLGSEAYDLLRYAAIVYGRAPLWFDRLAETMGDEELFGALQAYYDSNHCRRATGADLVAALRASTADPAAVDALFRRWIHEPHGFEDILGNAP